MEVWKVVLRLWALLSFLSLAIAGACIWLDLHGRATTLLLDTYEVSHVTVFLFTAPGPFFLAILMPILGVFLIFIRWCIGIDEPHAQPRKKPRADAIMPVPDPAARRKDAA